jgi:signal transduction histidine kinase
MNRDSARAERVEEIRKTISECLENTRQACKDKKGTYEYDRLHDFLRAEFYRLKSFGI